jgi:hypothetical protein
MSKVITKLRKEYDLSKILGCAPQDYGLYSVPITHNSSVYKLITGGIYKNVILDANVIQYLTFSVRNHAQGR